jgi:hypothetical protein
MNGCRMEVESPVKPGSIALCRTCNEQPELKLNKEPAAHSLKKLFTLQIALAPH